MTTAGRPIAGPDPSGRPGRRAVLAGAVAAAWTAPAMFGVASAAAASPEPEEPGEPGNIPDDETPTSKKTPTVKGSITGDPTSSGAITSSLADTGAELVAWAAGGAALIAGGAAARRASRSMASDSAEPSEIPQGETAPPTDQV